MHDWLSNKTSNFLESKESHLKSEKSISRYLWPYYEEEVLSDISQNWVFSKPSSIQDEFYQLEKATEPLDEEFTIVMMDWAKPSNSSRSKLSITDT